jgi:hypothetical protein
MLLVAGDPGCTATGTTSHNPANPIDDCHSPYQVLEGPEACLTVRRMTVVFCKDRR